MPKFRASSLLVCLGMTVGCHMNRPPIEPPDVAWSTYHGRLAEQCSEKHLEAMPAEKLNEIAVEYYKNTDQQIQQLIEADTRRACGKEMGAECYNTGFMQASMQAGTMEEFALSVCGKS